MAQSRDGDVPVTLAYHGRMTELDNLRESITNLKTTLSKDAGHPVLSSKTGPIGTPIIDGIYTVLEALSARIDALANGEREIEIELGTIKKPATPVVSPLVSDVPGPGGGVMPRTDKRSISLKNMGQ